MKNSFPIFVVITVIAIIFRCSVEGNEQVVFLVSIINVLALLVVVWTIVSTLSQAIITTIDKSDRPREIKKRNKHRVVNEINWVVFVVIIVASIVYLTKFSSELGNDLVSIVALGLSLSDKQIINVVLDRLK